jgi:hypothetical protein
MESGYKENHIIVSDLEWAEVLVPLFQKLEL